MSVEYYYMNDLNTLYNASVGDKTDGGEHHMKMMVAHDNLEAYMQKMEHWRDTALQLSRNNGEAQAKINALEADYVISNRELLVKQVEIQGLTARIAELEGELAELKERFDITDGLLNQATVSIGAVIACCTYNSNAEAMAGAYGISYRAFTMIDNFIKNYNRAVLDGKVSVDVKVGVKKEFCPNCDAEVPCTHEAELYVCDICGEDFAKYIVSRNCNVSDVSMTQDVLTDVKTPSSIEIEDLETVVEHLKIRLSEWQGVARQLADELVEANSERLPVSWEEPGETSRAMIAYRNLVDIEDMEANDAKQRS